MRTNVVQAPGKAVVATEVIAQSIKEIADGMRKLRAGQMNERALLLLIQHSTPSRIGVSAILEVLNALDSLDRSYLKKKAGS